MRKILNLLLTLILLTAFSCSRDDDPERSGIATIDNIRSPGTYAVIGFLFSEGKKVSKLDKPEPDITIDSDGTKLLFMTNNFKNSFYKEGEYNDAAAALAAFNALTSPVVPSEAWTGLASPLAENQIWIYRSGLDTYAKIRIISLIAEIRDGRDYAECTFEWEYQPDGTLTFPGK
ncbi:MAG: hypothetical protein RBT38_10740 [Bacteroidales bacterium]|jgi:hypothetical protein|nr:hypothetical protein [Bacteroidales bacterium]